MVGDSDDAVFVESVFVVTEPVIDVGVTVSTVGWLVDGFTMEHLTFCSQSQY